MRDGRQRTQNGKRMPNMICKKKSKRVLGFVDLADQGVSKRRTESNFDGKGREMVVEAGKC
jgi:hypothetical protein